MGNDISRFQQHQQQKQQQQQQQQQLVSSLLDCDSLQSGYAHSPKFARNVSFLPLPEQPPKSPIDKISQKFYPRGYPSFKDLGGKKTTAGKFCWNDEGLEWMLPLNTNQEGRMALMHGPNRLAIDGYFKSPVDHVLSVGGRILDVGTGTGTWAMEVAKKYERSQVIGIDVSDAMVNISAKRTANYKFVNTNIFEPLPFPDGHFDLIYCRLMVLNIPPQKWSFLVREFIRIIKLGGYIELVETDYQLYNAGPIVEPINNQLLAAIIKYTNVDPRLGKTIASKLENQEELIFVTSDYFSLPFGWGGPMGEVIKNTTKHLLTSLVKAGAMEPFNQDHMKQIFEVECPENKAYYNFHWVYAQRSTLI